jgi:hypothetical protein
MNAIVGTNGLIGSYLKTVVEHTHEFNSDNINDICKYKFNTVYIAAPTGNRLWANDNAMRDFDNVQRLYSALTYSSTPLIDRVVLIGTVDSVLRNHLPYGRNRRWLELKLNEQFNPYILRLGALIHPTIKKNVLYDLKHGQYLDSINLNLQTQWYDLNDLGKDIHFSLLADQHERNLLSEPISNREIVEQFFPNLDLKDNEVINQNVAPYIYTKQEIFQAMKKYLDE